MQILKKKTINHQHHTLLSSVSVQNKVINFVGFPFVSEDKQTLTFSDEHLHNVYFFRLIKGY